MMPGLISETIAEKLHGRSGGNSILKSFTPCGGGCINNGGKLVTECGEYFVKWNDAADYPGMFEAEARGLGYLADGTWLKIPTVILTGECGQYQYLVLSWIDSTPRATNYWHNLGEGLAELHHRTATDFGLEHHNYIGSLTQTNTRQKEWTSFFVQQRLEPQLKLALSKGLIDSSIKQKFEKLCAKLQAYLPEEKPALLHGDLWSGNIMVNAAGLPALIDPAVYFGSREMDLAMTTLFGGFHQNFYSAYEGVFPLEAGSRDRWQIYNLYPLLVHLNLFGSSYRDQILTTLRRFAG